MELRKLAQQLVLLEARVQTQSFQYLRQLADLMELEVALLDLVYRWPTTEDLPQALAPLVPLGLQPWQQQYLCKVGQEGLVVED